MKKRKQKKKVGKKNRTTKTKTTKTAKQSKGKEKKNERKTEERRQERKNDQLIDWSLIAISQPRGSPCQDPEGNWTTWKSSDDRKETQTAVVWSCFPFIRPGQNIVKGTVKGGRRQGGQRKRWEDNIREWTDLSSASPRGLWRTGKNGENRLQNHLWCPNDPRG